MLIVSELLILLNCCQTVKDDDDDDDDEEEEIYMGPPPIVLLLYVDQVSIVLLLLLLLLFKMRLLLWSFKLINFQLLFLFCCWCWCWCCLRWHCCSETLRWSDINCFSCGCFFMNLLFKFSLTCGHNYCCFFCKMMRHELLLEIAMILLL